MKKLFSGSRLCILSSCYLLLAFPSLARTDYTKYVDPFVGTGGHGHTYPGATLPFGMVQLSPDTRDDGSWDGCGGYHYSDSLVFGFSHTHLSGTGCSDYGDILLMPVNDSVNVLKKYSASYHHANEKASAGSYSVTFDNGITAELSATTRVGIHRYTFPMGSKPGVVLDLMHRDKILEATLKIVDDHTLEGFRRSEAWAKDQVVYFRMEFSSPFYIQQSKKDSLQTDNNGKMKELIGNIRAWLRFDLKRGQQLLVKVAISGVSEEGAKRNMDAELPHWDFEKVKNEAHEAWKKELSKIEVSGGTDEQMKVFYTALYHSMVQPNIYNDVDGQYRGRDFKIHKAEGFNYYTVFSLWDTFRAWHPLMTIIDRKRSLDFIKTFLAQYEQGGLLPVWELSSNETECMIGYHSVSVITDAAIKGITGFNMEEALVAMKKSAESRDRYGLGAYMDKGCLSIEDEANSVSKTLEYAYDDWCIAQMAQLLHHEKDYQYFSERSQSWKNLYDPKTGFIRPRKNGGWLEPFDPFEVNNNYTEANAWQYTFFVPQEIGSLIAMSGGKEKFEKKLDELFTAESKTTGREQADITGMIGQYAHGNEPSHHMAYLYDFIDKPWKTNARVHQVLNEMYHPLPDGLIGNEDCGQMSAWYVMSAIGLYETCPGAITYDVNPALFPKVILHLENGKQFEIDQIGKWNPNSFIQTITINKKPYTSNRTISSEVIMEGGTMDCNLQTYGHALTGYPETKFSHDNTSSTLPPITESPVIAANPSFNYHQTVSISPLYNEDAIYYTTDNSDPSIKSKKYSAPFSIDSSTVVKAIAVGKDGVQSKISTSHLFRNPHPDWKIHVVSKFSAQYTAGGDEGIIDGIRGELEWTKGNWQGHQKDFECVIDLRKEQKVGSMSAGFLQDVRAWIMMPKQVEFSFSTDGINFSDNTVIRNSVRDSDYTTQIKDFRTSLFRPVIARYVKVKAINYGKLPEWHPGAGGDAWIFVDEISIQ